MADVKGIILGECASFFLVFCRQLAARPVKSLPFVRDFGKLCLILWRFLQNA
ncbi:MAG: hypothetical protein J1E77_07055 [Prevotella sp.]|nr:hypothetical protein [Prevotella sp.]